MEASMRSANAASGPGRWACVARRPGPSSSGWTSVRRYTATAVPTAAAAIRSVTGSSMGIVVGAMLAPPPAREPQSAGGGVVSYADASSSSGRWNAPRVGPNRMSPDTMKTPRNAYSWVTPVRSIASTPNAAQMP